MYLQAKGWGKEEFGFKLRYFDRSSFVCSHGQRMGESDSPLESDFVGGEYAGLALGPLEFTF